MRRCASRRGAARRAWLVLVGVDRLDRLASHGTTRHDAARRATHGDLHSTCSIGDAATVSPSATTAVPPRAISPSTITAWCSAPSRSRMTSCSKLPSTRRYTRVSPAACSRLCRYSTRLELGPKKKNQNTEYITRCCLSMNKYPMCYLPLS